MNQTDYIELLQSLKSLGYQCCTLDQIRPAKGQLFLRHDVDLDLDFAAEMAELEASIGFRSTFYVMVSSEFYNLFAFESLSSLRRIVKAGHHVGLHFDSAGCGDVNDDLDVKARGEVALLSAALGEPVRSISFHRPIPSLQNMDRTVAGYRHTYMPKFFSEMKYFSDSGGSFRFGHPLNDESVQRCDALQLLTHPVWWFQKGDSTKQKLLAFRSRRDDRLRNSMTENLKPYAALVESGEA